MSAPTMTSHEVYCGKRKRWQLCMMACFIEPTALSVPLKEGTLEITPWSWLCLIPVQGYVRLHTEPIQITVLPGEIWTSSCFPKSPNERKLSPAPQNPQGTMFPTWLWAIPPLLPLCAIGGQWRRRKLQRCQRRRC